MFCKNCGEKIDPTSKFCQNCGEKIENVQNVSNDSTPQGITSDTSENTKISPSPCKDQKPFSIKEWFYSFIKINNGKYCKQCGVFIGKNKHCPSCHTPKKNPFNNYCEYCGGSVVGNICTQSNVRVKSQALNTVEFIFIVLIKLLSAIAIFGGLIELISGVGSVASGLIILGTTIMANTFLAQPTQIYKFKSLLVQKKFNPWLILIVYVLVIALIISSIYIDVENAGMTEEDIAAYELIEEGAYSFKNPSSVRLVSGKVYYDEEIDKYCGWFGLSATNGYGARSVGYYFIGYLDGEFFILDLEENGAESSIYYAKTRGELNVEKINKKLEKNI